MNQTPDLRTAVDLLNRARPVVARIAHDRAKADDVDGVDAALEILRHLEAVDDLLRMLKAPAAPVAR